MESSSAITSINTSTTVVRITAEMVDNIVVPPSGVSLGLVEKEGVTAELLGVMCVVCGMAVTRIPVCVCACAHTMSDA